MLRILCFSILIFPALTIASSVPPDIDPALQQLLATQAERLAGGDSDRTAFNNDLSGLAEKGDPVAQYLLAVSGGSENREKTEKLLLSSASSGCVGAAGVLGLMYMDNQQFEPGSYWLRYAAENGDAGSQVMLANFHLAGINNFSKDPVEALAWLRIAEKQAYSSGTWTIIVIRIVQLENSLASEAKNAMMKRFSELENKIPHVEYHLCGQSQPGRNRDFTKQNYEKSIDQKAQ